MVFRALERALIPILLKASFCASLGAAIIIALGCYSFWQSWWIFLFCLMAPIIRAFSITARKQEITQKN
jgi:hypothetical protein